MTVSERTTQLIEEEIETTSDEIETIAARRPKQITNAIPLVINNYSRRTKMLAVGLTTLVVIAASFGLY